MMLKAPNKVVCLVLVGLLLALLLLPAGLTTTAGPGSAGAAFDAFHGLRTIEASVHDAEKAPARAGVIAGPPSGSGGGSGGG
jgi:hypothetical protein